MRVASLFHGSEGGHDAGLAALRIGTGLVFAMHGYQKVFVSGFSGITAKFAGMGVPMPGVMGPFIALLELLGGIALIVGLLTRLAAFGLACDMFGAIVLVHLANGFFLPKGYEFVVLLFVNALTLACAGAGRYSLDAGIARRGGQSGIE
ncbi:MAG: DoxX family protein [Gemmatimonadaceae bacterium]|nr:DoxX family protein [Gemmatimonadaceae bacterium]